MLAQLVLLVLFQAITADPIHMKEEYNADDFESAGQLFEKSIIEFKRTYSGAEKLERFGYFVENLKNINQLNKKYKATFGINNFTDMSRDERARFHSGFQIKDIDPNGNCTVKGDPTTKDAPAALDWRDKNLVSPVKNQAYCGSCWAFSTIALVESRYLAQGKQLILSEQQLLDCDKASKGCEGGNIATGLSEVMNDGGLQSEGDYPYEAFTRKCRFIKSKAVATVKSCYTYSLTSEDALKELLFKEGPLSISVAAAGYWLPYSGGILDHCGSLDLNHDVLLVGYGSEDGTDFWIIKNSWGQNWGEDGYIRLKRGVNCAGINDPNSYTKVSAVIG